MLCSRFTCLLFPPTPPTSVQAVAPKKKCTPTTLTLLTYMCTYTCLLCCRCCGSGCLLVNTFDIRILFLQVIFLTIFSLQFSPKHNCTKKHNRPTRNYQPTRIITYHVARLILLLYSSIIFSIYIIYSNVLTKYIFSFCLLFFSFLFSLK